MAPLEDVSDPIEALYADHARLQDLSEQLVNLADNLDAEDVPHVAAPILDFLENLLPIHLADEEEDFFPLLKRHSRKEDRIVPILDLLVEEHGEDIEFGQRLLEPLRMITAGKQIAEPELFIHHVRAFRVLQRRHQAIENCIVLPLAMERLSGDDKAELGRKMAARRGVPHSH